ncbi:MAG: protoglobin domain-containing protein, partial [Solirubrobacteraceae bacterium]
MLATIPVEDSFTALLEPTDEDRALLARHHDFFRLHVDAVVRQWLDAVMAVPELRELVAQHSDVNRLAELQRGFFLSVADRRQGDRATTPAQLREDMQRVG